MSTESKSDPLEELFDYLAPDRDRAAERYEALREALLQFFKHRRVLSPEDLTDRTLDRIGQKIAEGEQIRNINAYSRAVADLIFKEWIHREHDHRHDPIESEDSLPPAPFVSEQEQAEEDRAEENRWKCRMKCLRELPADSFEFIEEYFEGQGRDRIDRRETMAARLGISRTALGNRVNRLVSKLRECERRCLKWKSV